MKKINIDNYILENYKTKTNAQMALECGCHRSTISNKRKKLGISATELNKALREKTSYICEMYGRKTAHQISNELSCSVSFVRKIWEENGLCGTKSTVYSYKENYFEKIDTPEKAYWLGFIASDGCLYRREGHQGMISLSVNEKDVEILDNFKKELDTAKPISISTDKRRPNTKMASLQITGDKIFNDILSLGIGVRKTFDMELDKIFENIPKKFIFDFILGYFDGDGSIYIPQERKISESHICIAAPIKSLEVFQKILLLYNIESSIIKDKRKYSQPFGRLELKNTTEKYCFLKKIYSSNIKSLIRKKERANILLQRIEDNATNHSENIKAVNFYKSVVLKREELLER